LISRVGDFDSRWLYYSSVLGKSFDTQVWLAKKMKKCGTKLAFNPSEYLIRNLDIRELLGLSDIVILNKEEFDLATKKYGEDFCLGVVVVTNKDKKVVVYEGCKKYFIMPNKNVKVVERTGAGDAFASGFVAGIMAGWSIDKSLKFALREGESVLGHFGAKNNLIRRKLK
jgi:ribokinase